MSGAAPQALFDLTGRRALVTGSSRGLGRAVSEALAGAGAQVVLNGVDPGRLAEAEAEMRAAGHDVSAAAFDVTDEDAVTDCFRRLDRAGLAVDILVNNAGVNLRAPLMETTMADWRKVLDTNLTAAFRLAQEAARRMIPRGRGKIVNIGSIAAEIVRPTIGPYAASKGGLKQLTRVMAAEWAGHGLQANAIAPGMMLTDMNRPLSEDAAFAEWLQGRVPAGRWGRPEDLAGAAVFFAAPASDFVNGQTLCVDGAMTAVF